MTPDPDSFAGTEDERRDKASGPILSALHKAETEFHEWDAVCYNIDRVYSLHGLPYGGTTTIDQSWRDSTFDLFWSSFEIMKPAVYARPPRPAVKPLFSDADTVKTTTAELLERAATSVFVRTNMGDVMCEIRDDLLFAGRGVMWLRYEDDDGQKVCVEHLDRTDFRHEPARKWSEVGWVAGGFWLTRDELKKRFKGLTEEQIESANFTVRRDKEDPNDQAGSQKCRVWEVWHKADNKVYWITEGIDVLLDSDAPHLKLNGFFPCPRPAYGTLRRRSLVPVPDFERYSIHFKKIGELTARIYSLLDAVKMKGIVAGGGDIASAVDELIRSEDDQIVIRVPSMSTDATGLVVWLPLVEVATAITGLITARSQLISDFYELSGISDIMRGATDAEETLGAQQLKSQYGSVRVREKVDELQRIAADAVKIAAEIIAEKFKPDTILEMAQMELPKRKDIEKRIREIEKAAEGELKALSDKAEKAAQGAQQGQEQQIDPQQAQAAFTEAQQGILAKYAPMLAEAEQQVPIEAVMELLRDDKARSFAFEIESDSTILTDELQEKSSRSEFLQVFTAASQGLMGLSAMGEPGAKLAGEMIKFVLAPYRAGRQLDGAIDAFIESAPEMAKAAAGESGESDALAEANNKLAEAEMQKAKAAMAGVEAKAALDKAEMQRKLMEMGQKAKDAEFKANAETEKLRQSLSAEEAKTALISAQVNKLTAETAEILSSIGLDERRQELEEYRTAADQQNRQVDREMQAENTAADHEFRERGESRADRQQDFTEQSASQEAAEDGAAPPVAPAPKQSPTAAIMDGLMMLGQMVEGQSAALAQIGALIAAPTELVRDEAGRPVGARKVI